MSKKPNRSIHCDVADCQNICDGNCYCSLDSISVGCDRKSGMHTNCCSFISRGFGTDENYGPAKMLVERFPGVVDNRSDSANLTDQRTYPWGPEY